MIIRKEGLVSIEMDTFEAALFAPERLAEIERTRPGYLLQDEYAVRQRYVVEVRRITTLVEGLDGGNAARHTWYAEIETGGEVWRIPGPVLERIIRYRDSLITEGREIAGREQADMRRGVLPEAEAA